MNRQNTPNGRARCGKIARLPIEIREQLNRHLCDNQPGPDILGWLNSLLQTRQILDAQFHGAPISKQNLSQWRHGGYADWLLRQDVLAQIALHVRLKANQAQSNQNVAGQTESNLAPATPL